MKIYRRGTVRGGADAAPTRLDRVDSVKKKQAGPSGKLLKELSLDRGTKFQVSKQLS